MSPSVNDLHARFQSLLCSTPTPGFGEQQAWSRDLDRETGVDSPEIEAKIRASKRSYASEVWSHVPVETFQTPYHELRVLLESYPAQHWVELGAGYGRLGFMLGTCRPDATYLGIELVRERASAAIQRFHAYRMNNCRMSESNLLSVNAEWLQEGLRESPDGWTNYFVYDFSHPHDLRQLLELFRVRLSGRRSFRIIARGRAFRHLILNEAPWLIPENGAHHGERSSVFEVILQ